jgi:hypothetical protein
MNNVSSDNSVNRFLQQYVKRPISGVVDITKCWIKAEIEFIKEKPLKAVALKTLDVKFTHYDNSNLSNKIKGFIGGALYYFDLTKTPYYHIDMTKTYQYPVIINA